jgi:hypothetical protein
MSVKESVILPLKKNGGYVAPSKPTEKKQPSPIKKEK